LLVLDIDLFKQVNDTFGHAEGDRVLAEIGRIINNHCRSEDVAGRIGGDEFLIFMRNINIPENACSFAERLLQEVRTAFEEDPLKGRISLSIGIALCPEHGSRFEDLYKAADEALYYVKNHGKAGYRVRGTYEDIS
jgi:diguanylate cyclase (GGDEF)-like protein